MKSKKEFVAFAPWVPGFASTIPLLMKHGVKQMEDLQLAEKF